MFIRQVPNGDWYVCKSFLVRRGNLPKKINPDLYTNMHLIKAGTTGYRVKIDDICFPKEFAGKRVRLKVEVVEDEM